ncbi:hypothetical protein POSPLADRAFT_1036975 [Postia placenta MAD-698-R-SB12]|uniref:Amino acid permease/ SLC12A domain-containing protein n=1 Tax=Postia placenta MAD-698-R-SB12 TaxID=670580 RepID=A0A1X6ML05_9APHY|nr:hypothetical protein POSPLADRAFT_1036975 [Postia placenta MAD-698-R-SB12]OSX57087.1 hypothetical protein POSPLADRAFT_1036975 [Postia placenta MAD-698-R-SB12]
MSGASSRSVRRVQIHDARRSPSRGPPVSRRVIIEDKLPPRQAAPRISQRVLDFQRQWKSIKDDLPPQFSRRHSGVVGTGLFLGSGQSLVYGGPLGALLGYSIIGSLVYCLCVSIGEMIAYLPNVGGVVGIADLYVDKAFGFALGWASWSMAISPYSFSNNIQQLGTATMVNLLPSRMYGEFEFWFSCLKVGTIATLLLSCLLIDIGAGQAQAIPPTSSHLTQHILFKNWDPPFANSYLGIRGVKGQFLGFLAVLNQAAFSFFGSEVPGIAAGEVIDATRNVPRALKRVWVRIILIYILSIFAVGLTVPQTSVDLRANASNGLSSPFVIALSRAKWTVPANFINAIIMLSAFSAAASDIYIGSRFMFFLARRGHAPGFLASLIKYPQDKTSAQEVEEEDTDSDEEEDTDSDEEEDWHSAIESFTNANSTKHSDEEAVQHPSFHKPSMIWTIPLASVLVSASIGLLAYTATSKSSSVVSRMSTPPSATATTIVIRGATMALSTHTSDTMGVSEAFQILASMASVASLISWSGMLFTYIRWYHGTVHAERKWSTGDPNKVLAQIDKIKEHRHKWQPYLAYYAFSICVIVLLTNGWYEISHDLKYGLATHDNQHSGEYLYTTTGLLPPLARKSPGHAMRGRALPF